MNRYDKMTNWDYLVMLDRLSIKMLGLYWQHDDNDTTWAHK